jgi:hypothetical protein
LGVRKTPKIEGFRLFIGDIETLDKVFK